MSQHPFQDITPRRSIRDIPLQKKSLPEQEHQPQQESASQPIESEEKETYREKHEENPQPDEFDQHKSRSPRWLIWSVSTIGLLALFFTASLFFAGAEVSVLPKTETMNVSLAVTSTKDGSNGTLPYDVIILNREEGLSLQTPSTTTVTQATTSSRSASTSTLVPISSKPAAKASGLITITNTYSSSSQVLIATTRFETPSGLVYRIKKDITVPGVSVVNNKNVPGSIDTTVDADQIGEKYNIAPSSFTIPGFKGTAKFDGFSAQSKSVMSGGSNGNSSTSAQVQLKSVQVTDPQDEIRISLENQIKNDLIKEAQAQIPDTYIVFPTSSLFLFKKASSTQDFTSNGGNNASLREQGTAYFVIFEKDKLTRFLQSQLIASTSQQAAHIININSISVTLASTTIQNIIESAPLNIHIDGTLPISWNINSSDLANDLKGKSKQSLKSVLEKYPEVATAEAAIRPFWKSNFPVEANNIKIVLKK